MSDQLLGRSVLGRVPLRRTAIRVEEWGGSILIRQLSHAEKIEIDSIAMEAVDLTKNTIRDRAKLPRAAFALIQASWIDEEGNHVLGKEDYTALVSESDQVIQFLLAAIRDFNGIGRDAQEQAKKNLEAIQSNGFGTN